MASGLEPGFEHTLSSELAPRNSTVLYAKEHEANWERPRAWGKESLGWVNLREGFLPTGGVKSPLAAAALACFPGVNGNSGRGTIQTCKSHREVEKTSTVLILHGPPERAPPPCPAVTLAMNWAGVVEGDSDGTSFAPPLLPSSPFSSPSALALSLGTMSKSLTAVQWKALSTLLPSACLDTLRDTPTSSSTSKGKGEGTVAGREERRTVF